MTRLIHWIFEAKGKGCTSCCIWCEYFEICKRDGENHEKEKDKRDRP